jgi:hypothetical protein
VQACPDEDCWYINSPLPADPTACEACDDACEKGVDADHSGCVGHFIGEKTAACQTEQVAEDVSVAACQTEPQAVFVCAGTQASPDVTCRACQAEDHSSDAACDKGAETEPQISDLLGTQTDYTQDACNDALVEAFPETREAHIQTCDKSIIVYCDGAEHETKPSDVLGSACEKSDPMSYYDANWQADSLADTITNLGVSCETSGDSVSSRVVTYNSSTAEPPSFELARGAVSGRGAHQRQLSASTQAKPADTAGRMGMSKGQRTRKVVASDFEEVVVKAVEVLQAENPRCHSNYMSSRSDVGQLAKLTNNVPWARDLIQQLLEKLNAS